MKHELDRLAGTEDISVLIDLLEHRGNVEKMFEIEGILGGLKGESLFDFLIIDDPIQSWDAEHEIQFIEIIRRLVERGKQVILMSHNRKWIDMVRGGCRTINGRFYEVTGYTEIGPHIEEVPWVEWIERLKEVDAIVE